MTTSSKKQKIILKKIKPSGIIWHPDSTLVFKSATDKVVIGRMQNEVFIEMDEKTLDLCNEYNFIPDDSLLESDHDDKENCDDEVDAHDDVPPDDEVDEQDDVPPDDEVDEQDDVPPDDEVDAHDDVPPDDEVDAHDDVPPDDEVDAHDDVPPDDEVDAHDDEVDAHDDVPPDEVDEQDDVPPDDEVENITSKSKIHLDGIMEYVSKLSVNNEILLANSRSRNKEIQELKNTIDNLKLQVENNNTRLTQLKNLLI
jgi:hypothetical protein